MWRPVNLQLNWFLPQVPTAGCCEGLSCHLQGAHCGHMRVLKAVQSCHPQRRNLILCIITALDPKISCVWNFMFLFASAAWWLATMIVSKQKHLLEVTVFSMHCLWVFARRSRDQSAQMRTTGVCAPALAGDLLYFLKGQPVNPPKTLVSFDQWAELVRQHR